MRGRVVRRVVAATVTGMLAASASARAADPATAESKLVVDVRMSVAQDVPPSVVAGLKAEAESIWRAAGVTLRWTVPPDEALADASLRVLVMARSGPADASRHTWPVGELLIDQAGSHFAVVSTAAARRVVAAVGAPHEPQALGRSPSGAGAGSGGRARAGTLPAGNRRAHAVRPDARLRGRRRFRRSAPGRLRDRGDGRRSDPGRVAPGHCGGLAGRGQFPTPALTIAPGGADAPSDADSQNRCSRGGRPTCTTCRVAWRRRRPAGVP